MKIAKVVANPYCAIDADGIPQGVVGVPAMGGVYVGARLDPVASEKSGKKRFYFPPDKDGKPRIVEIRVDHALVRGHIARAVNDGALIAADEETARCFGIPVNDEEPKAGYQHFTKVLEAEREKALESFQAVHGKTAKLAPVPTEEMPREDSDAQAPGDEAVRLGSDLTLKHDIMHGGV